MKVVEIIYKKLYSEQKPLSIANNERGAAAVKELKVVAHEPLVILGSNPILANRVLQRAGERTEH
jgi:hypothetical protein